MIHQPYNLARKAVAIIIGAALVAPTAFVFAEDGVTAGAKVRVGLSGRGADASMGIGINFCTNLDALTSKIDARIPKRQENRDDRLDDRITKVGNKFQLRLTKLDDHRLDWDKNREERYTKLQARATTTAEIAAVATFKTNVDAAVKVRRDAVDAAVKAFQDAVNKLLADRKTAVDAAFAKLKTDTDAALLKAKTSCTGGADPKTVRVTFVADLKAATDAFKTSIKPSVTLESQIKTLRDTRDAAVKAAMTAFKATLDAELAKLKAAFGASA